MMKSKRSGEKSSFPPSPIESFRSLFPELVSGAGQDQDYLLVCWECLNVLNDTFKLPYSDIQPVVIPAVLHKEGLSAEDVRTATRIMLSSESFAEQARYRSPLSAADFIKALREKAPHRLIK